MNKFFTIITIIALTIASCTKPENDDLGYLDAMTEQVVTPTTTEVASTTTATATTTVATTTVATTTTATATTDVASETTETATETKEEETEIVEESTTQTETVVEEEVVEEEVVGAVTTDTPVKTEEEEEQVITYTTEVIAGVNVHIVDGFEFGYPNIERYQLEQGIESARGAIQRSIASDEIMPIFDNASIYLFADSSSDAAFGYADTVNNQIGLNGRYMSGNPNTYFERIAGVLIHELAHFYDYAEYNYEIGFELFDFDNITFEGGNHNGFVFTPYYTVNEAEFFACLFTAWLGFAEGSHYISDDESSYEDWVDTLIIEFGN